MVVIQHYLYVLSTWSLVAEKAVDEILEHFGDDVRYEWYVANYDYGAHGQFDQDQLRGFYARLEDATGEHMNAAWWREGYDWTVPDRVVVAARALGATGRDVRLAIANAGLRDGQSITSPGVALQIACDTGALDYDELRYRFEEPSTAYELQQMSDDFKTTGVSLRPAFRLRNAIEDTAIFSGVWKAAPIIAAIETLLEDERDYQRYHHAHTTAG